jgi:cytochrome c556
MSIRLPDRASTAYSCQLLVKQPQGRDLTYTIRQVALALGGVFLLSMLTYAADIDARQIVKAREDSFHKLGKAAKKLGDDLDRWTPNRADINDDAETILELARELHNWFPEGTGPGAGIKTRALSVIWSSPQEFKEDAETFAFEAEKLVQIAQSSDLPVVRAQGKVLAGACRTCHRGFRARGD